VTNAETVHAEPKGHGRRCGRPDATVVKASKRLPELHVSMHGQKADKDDRSTDDRADAEC